MNQLASILHEEELPLINLLQTETEDFEINRKFKAKTKACESVKRMMSKQLSSYFLHWKDLNDFFKEKLRTTVKSKIIKFYFDQLRSAFVSWKTLHAASQLASHQMVIQEFSDQGTALTNEVLCLKRDNQAKQEQRDCSQQKGVLKCVTSY